MDEGKKVAPEDIQYRAREIEKIDNASFFEKPSDVKRKKKEEEKRARAEAKRVLRESRSSKAVGPGRIKQSRSEHVPMSSETRLRIRKAVFIVLVVIVSAAAVTGITLGMIYLYSTYWKTEKTSTISDEERARVLSDVKNYYFEKSDDEIDEDAEAIYKYLGGIYDQYEDKEIRLACLYRRIGLLYTIESFREKELEDAKEAEKLEKSAKSANWLKTIYELMGDAENAQKYQQKQEERLKKTVPEEEGEG
ncbi:hypothetical protein IKQ65_01060 [Candidatus Saccharibacteria bacterium]|nr:hypothetical protein [Candidatus Saccharibacteria bacterium]